VLAPAAQIRTVRVSAERFIEVALADSGIYGQAGCRVIAIEDETGRSVTVDPHERLTGTEQLVLVGPDKAVQVP